MMSLYFSVSTRDNYSAGTSHPRTQNRKRHASSSSDSSSSGHARRRHRHSSHAEATWVPAETSKTNLSHLVGSSKFSTTRSYDDSRVNPERKRNLSDSIAGEMFGPTLPPSEETEVHPQQSSGSDSSARSKQETESRQHRKSRNGEKTSKDEDEIGLVRSVSSSRRQNIARSRDSSLTSRSSRRSSRSRSFSSDTSSSPTSKSKKKLSRAESRSSVVSRSKRRTSRTRRSSSSSRSSSRTKVRRKRVRHSSSFSRSRSSGSNYQSKSDRKKATGARSRRDQFQAQNGNRRDKQGLRRHSDVGGESRRHIAKERTNVALPRKNLSFGNRRKSRSNSGDRSEKRVPVNQVNLSGRKGKGFEHQSRKNGDDKESRLTARSDAVKDVRTEARGKPLANYSSSDDDEKARIPQNRSDIAQKSSTAVRKVTDSKMVTSSRQSDTTSAAAAAGGRYKDTDNGKTKTGDRPKETLEDMELFLKQLKANKQQMLKKQQ